MFRVVTRAKGSICPRSYDEKGQTATEYVLLIFVAVLGLIVTAVALRFALITAGDQIGSWTASIQLPSAGPSGGQGSSSGAGQGQKGTRGGGEDNSNNQGKHNGDNVNGH